MKQKQNGNETIVKRIKNENETRMKQKTEVKNIKIYTLDKGQTELSEKVKMEQGQSDSETDKKDIYCENETDLQHNIRGEKELKKEKDFY